eukprot:3609772-Rhodomonas_salina.3
MRSASSSRSSRAGKHAGASQRASLGQSSAASSRLRMASAGSGLVFLAAQTAASTANATSGAVWSRRGSRLASRKLRIGGCWDSVRAGTRAPMRSRSSRSRPRQVTAARASPGIAATKAWSVPSSSRPRRSPRGAASAGASVS